MPNTPMERLRELHALADGGGITNWSELQRWREEALGLLRSILPEGHERVERFAQYPTRTSYRRNVGYTPRGRPSEAEELYTKVDTLTSILSGVLTEVSARHYSSPEIGTDGLHPWVSGAVAGLWSGDHFRQAVDEATRAVEIRTKAKLGVDLSGYQLFTEAFNTDAPRPDRPRLRFEGFDNGTQSWTNAHQGAMHFGQGCVMRIRNILEHHELELDEQEALECLAAFSLLARWVDQAVVVAAE